MTVTFDQPLFLLLGLLALPLVVIGWRATVGMDRARRIMAMTLRTFLLLCMCVILTGPRLRQTHDHLTVIGLLDVSGSVKRFAELPDAPNLASRSTIEYLRQWFRRATESKAPDDRFGLIVFDGTAIAIAAPTTTDYVDDNLDITLYEGTNIAEAVRLGLAMFPADTSRRLVLVSDGNETSGDVLEAARQAAGGVDVELADLAVDRLSVPIDVLPLTYRVTGDVQVVRVEAPPSAEPGQRVTVRVILEATRPTEGSLSLFRESSPVDINGAAPGGARRVSLPEGQSVHLAQVTLGSTPINRFQALFEPDDPNDDLLNDNNVADAFTATPARGSVLVLDRRAPNEPNFLAELFVQAGMPARAESPTLFPIDLLSLQAFDLIVLDNVASSELSTQQHQLISRFVSDLGGGLIMVGGEDSFGAGGWNGTAVEDVLPVELDPPKEMRLPTAALVLVLDRSGSMARRVAGTRATQQFVANEAAALAIESLRTDSLVGVIGFNMLPRVEVPLRRNDDPRVISDAIRSITPDGGTNLADALLKAQEMLERVDVARKRIVCLSDGQSLEGDFGLIADGIASRNIKVTTIAVGDEVDTETMRLIAERGGGEFYPVRNPRILPRVLVDSVQAINKPLIKEVPFIPTVLPTGASLTMGLGEGPPLGGLVITAAKLDNKVVLEMVNDDSEPLLAHWQVGLGRVAAFTSDAQGQWSDIWLQWSPASTFWTQLARLISRPAVSQDAELVATIDEDRLQVALEIANEDEGFFDYLQVEGRVYRPDGESRPIRLRQTAPGRYEGSTEALQAGNYIVALNPRRGSKQLSPVIGGVSRATSPEFRAYESNAGVLDRVAEMTGGRKLVLHEPEAVDLFDRAGMPPSISNLPAWRFLLFAALALLLLDVATRRLAWSAEMIREGLSAAVAKVRPGHVRAKKATVTLASLRKVSETFDDRLDSDAEGLEKLKGTGMIAPPPERIEPLEDEPSPAREPRRVAAAFDTLLGRKRAKPAPEPEPKAEEEKQPEKAPPAATPEETSETDEDDSGIGSTETTSSLLAAKRRARRDLDR